MKQFLYKTLLLMYSVKCRMYNFGKNCFAIFYRLLFVVGSLSFVVKLKTLSEGYRKLFSFSAFQLFNFSTVVISSILLIFCLAVPAFADTTISEDTDISIIGPDSTTNNVPAATTYGLNIVGNLTITNGVTIAGNILSGNSTVTGTSGVTGTGGAAYGINTIGNLIIQDGSIISGNVTGGIGTGGGFNTSSGYTSGKGTGYGGNSYGISANEIQNANIQNLSVTGGMAFGGGFGYSYSNQGPYSSAGGDGTGGAAYGITTKNISNSIATINVEGGIAYGGGSQVLLPGGHTWSGG